MCVLCVCVCVLCVYKTIKGSLNEYNRATETS